MKTITNLGFSIKIDPRSQSDATAADLLLTCLGNPPQGGFDFVTMRKRSRIADVCEKVRNNVGAAIEFEDADFNEAVESVRAMKWGTLNKELLRFGELFGL